MNNQLKRCIHLITNYFFVSKILTSLKKMFQRSKLKMDPILSLLPHILLAEFCAIIHYSTYPFPYFSLVENCGRKNKITQKKRLKRRFW